MSKANRILNLDEASNNALDTWNTHKSDSPKDTFIDFYLGWVSHWENWSP